MSPSNLSARTVLVILAALATLVSLTAQGRAQTLAVETGEHASFTRLVVRIGSERSWQLEQTGRRWRLDLTPGVDGYNLARSFDVIPRTRVADLSQEGDALILDLACDCPVSAFRYLESFVVIDVSDPGSAGDIERGDSETASLLSGPQVGNETRDASDLAAVNTVAPERQQVSEPAERPDPAAAAIAAAALPDLARLLTPGRASNAASAEQVPRKLAESEAPPAPAESSRPDLEEAAAIMAEQLARAAAAGLLEPAAGTSLDFADPRRPQTERLSRTEAPSAPVGVQIDAPVQPTADTVVTETPSRLFPEDPPILVRNAFDIAVAPLPDTAPVQPRLACSGRVHWLDEPEISNDPNDDAEPDLGALRRALYDERDVLVEDAVLRLATHYLRQGFGAEAVFWLSQLDNPPSDLVALGHMADGLEVPDFASVSDPSACSDQELVFRYLAGAMQTPISEGEARRIQQGFAALPDQLQRRFGPEIARSLAAEGHTGTAHNVRDMLRRLGLIPEAELLTLELDLGLMPPVPGLDDALSRALRDDGAAPAATMSRRLAMDRQQGIMPDPGSLVAAQALLRETPAGQEADLLWREVTIGHARLGQVDAALSSLISGAGRDSDVWQSTVTGLVADRLAVEDSATLLILAHLVGHQWTASGSDTGRIRVAASRFLSEMGLEEAASQIASGRPPPAVPSRDPIDGDVADPASGWADSAWSESAESLSGARGDIARRMAAQEGTSEAVDRDPRDRTVDLEALEERIADSRALRDAADAILAGASSPRPAASDAP